ncbi:hypothetical protein [Vibrio algarum]|uniref:Uncharacterized protein n=1 Tax=Vibrio algarum TaxID=3020714 RepID=A0ABT4YRM1_9VIBR|nr:hypothetical protein [Vibrio sp. KJ40-1]MDB1123718.1 hypothetical protein [Vibrio sp. KJ40-1]
MGSRRHSNTPKKIGYNDTDTFENFASETRGNIIFIIKFLPSLEWIVKKKKDKKKLIFVPVDIFSSKEEIHHKRSIISLFDTIVIHNETIREYLRPYAHAIFNVEHYLKFDIGDKRKYIEKGNILWIGQIEYIPALLETLKDNAFKYPIVALTNIFYFNKKQSETVAEIERRVGHCHITEKDGIIIINGLRLEQWTEKNKIYT